MPDLEQQAVTRWFTGLVPDADAGAWPPPLRAIETTDDNAGRLRALGLVLDELTSSDLAAVLREATFQEDFRAVLAQLGAARLMRLLHWLGETDAAEPEGIVPALVAGDDEIGRALRAAIAAVTRRALLARIFAPERIAALEAACRTAFAETV
jgi:hypothetical protein